MRVLLRCNLFLLYSCIHMYLPSRRSHFCPMPVAVAIHVLLVVWISTSCCIMFLHDVSCILRCLGVPFCYSMGSCFCCCCRRHHEWFSYLYDIPLSCFKLGAVHATILHTCKSFMQVCRTAY